LDTREKIVSLSEARTRLLSGEWTLLTGLFDPLTATQAKRIHAARENGRSLAALILDSRNTLLPAADRAVLVAALRDVDLVFIGTEGGWQAALPDAPNIRIIEDSEGERNRSAEFARLVLERQWSA
jgi:hypothetical protein